MICHDFAVTSEEVHTEVMTTPSDRQCLIFDLRVVPFHTREGFHVFLWCLHETLCSAICLWFSLWLKRRDFSVVRTQMFSKVLQLHAIKGGPLCSACVGDNFTILHQQSSKSDRAYVDYYFNLESWVEVWHHLILGQAIFQPVKCQLLFVGPLPRCVFLGYRRVLLIRW